MAEDRLRHRCTVRRGEEAKIIALAHGADMFYCESPYLDHDVEKAHDRYHLTARQAGLMARKAKVRDLVVFHFSPRYTGQGAALEREIMEAFHGNEEGGYG